ncbi:MAG: PAS domain-containing protein, partial [Flavobacteriaceae bacterium]|nr:PAS domain-containing protein [Flavobacteriaceae bacterium]
MNIPKDELEKLLQDSDKSRAVLLSLLEDQQLKVNELHESKLKYKTLFENSPISLWEEDFSEVKKYLDQNFPNILLVEEFLNEYPDKIAHLASMVKTVNINQATIKLYKAKTKEELIDNLSKIYTVKSYDIFKQLIINLCNANYEFEAESVNKNIKGENFYIKLKYTVASGFEDSWERIIISVIDITQEKEFKEKLLQSEQRSLEAQAIAKIGNWYIDYHQNKVVRSQEIYNILETTEQELKPSLDAFKQLIAHDDLENYQRIFDESIQKQQSYEFLFRIVSPKGNYKYVIEKGQTFFDEKNEPIRTVGSLQDITEKKLAELKFQESQLQYQVLFNNAPIALFEEDFTEVIKKLNELGADAKNIHILMEDPNLLQQCLQLVFVNNVNQESLNLFKAIDKAHFHQFLPQIFTKHSIEIVKNIFIDITQGKSNSAHETVLRKVDGELF